jgi:hypothetical protein
VALCSTYTRALTSEIFFFFAVRGLPVLLPRVGGRRGNSAGSVGAGVMGVGEEGVGGKGISLKEGMKAFPLNAPVPNRFPSTK